MRKRKKSVPMTTEQAMTALFCYKDALHSARKSHVPREIILKMRQNFREIQTIIDTVIQSKQTTISGENAQNILNAFSRNVKIAKQYDIDLFTREILKDCSWAVFIFSKIIIIKNFFNEIIFSKIEIKKSRIGIFDH